MTHNELAARIERAEGPDRALDAEIYYDVLGFCRHTNKVRSGAQSDTGFDCVDCGADSWGNLGKHGQRLHNALPNYTESIDAAMQLVPEGMYWDLSGPTCAAVYGKDAGKYTAQCGSFPQDGFIIIRLAATPALALCAAALRARSAS